ncbi:MAG: hypothetical protein IPJ84_00185 [Bdellovibrionales bacterium]|nr:hypothetical protein [Bdellovibrionales bacterium]
MPIKQKNGVIWKGVGKKTVDVYALEQRFNSLGIKFDWKKFNEIGVIRNEVEHYFTKANPLTIQEALSKLFGLMQNFMSMELKIDPKTKFEDRLWNILINIDQVYEAEWMACSRTHKHFESESKNLGNHIAEITCPDCGSSLLRFKPGGSSECRACGETFEKERTIVALVDTVYGADDYVAAKEGAEPVIVACPECDEEAYIIEESRCAVCGESQESTCQRCNCSIPAGEIGGSYCSYCQHQIDKDD